MGIADIAIKYWLSYENHKYMSMFTVGITLKPAALCKLFARGQL
jgi:hypothetical protein